MNLEFSKSPALWCVAALLILAFRHPLELRLLRHEHAARPNLSGDPIQEAVSKESFELIADGHRYRVVPRFRWDESARVVSERAYHFGRAAALIPEDYALAWGPVTAAPYVKRIHFSQVARFYMWGTSDASLDRGTIVAHTANTHIIPATSRLRWAAACVSKGDDVRVEGWLVDVDGIDEPDFHWKTSTTRNDEGPGGCETVYVTRLTINRRVYE